MNFKMTVPFVFALIVTFCGGCVQEPVYRPGPSRWTPPVMPENQELRKKVAEKEYMAKVEQERAALQVELDKLPKRPLTHAEMEQEIKEGWEKIHRHEQILEDSKRTLAELESLVLIRESNK